MGVGIVLKRNELKSLEQDADLLGKEVQREVICGFAGLILDLEGEYGVIDLNGLREEFLEGILVR